MTHAIFAMMVMIALTACKPPAGAYSSVMVVNATVITSEKEARAHAKGAYGVQMVFTDGKGNTKRQEATGIFTDPKGTTFITNGHVNDYQAPAGYTLKERSIVDYAGNTVQTVPANVDAFVNPGAKTVADRDLAMWNFPQGTPAKKLTHGTAQFASPGYDVENQPLTMAGFGASTNSPLETAEYQKMRYGPIGNVTRTGNTFGFIGPRKNATTSDVVSSAHGDSSAAIYGSAGTVVGINRAGQNDNGDTSYSEAIDPYSPGATAFFNEVKSRGGVVDGWGAAGRQEASSTQAPTRTSAESPPTSTIPSRESLRPKGY